MLCGESAPMDEFCSLFQQESRCVAAFWRRVNGTGDLMRAHVKMISSWHTPGFAVYEQQCAFCKCLTLIKAIEFPRGGDPGSYSFNWTNAVSFAEDSIVWKSQLNHTYWLLMLTQDGNISYKISAGHAFEALKLVSLFLILFLIYTVL